MRLRFLIPLLLGVTVVGGLAACGSSHGGSAPSRALGRTDLGAGRLAIANYAYAPSVLTVKAGTTVTVRNIDHTAHTATARSGAFDSGTLEPGQYARFTLNKPGTYTFYCQFHAFMTGTIRVVR